MKGNNMTQYEVWQVGGGYFNSFKNYTQATELRDQLAKEYPKSRFQIIEVSK
jgi:hypothetical protein